MPQIQVLEKHVAELIAAGEVVERPASVVKELVENAIDAGAKNITVEIQNGGVALIRITDDGCGIARADVQTAFCSHATSKLREEADLHTIETLGFRGEALPCIAAVSKLELLTRTQEESIGTRFCMEGGQETLLDDAGCPAGSTILVRNLFYNTPARMKFLKKDVSEANAVAAVIDKLALSNPQIRFLFIREGKQTLLTPGNGELLTCAAAVFGKEFAEGLISASYELEGIQVQGYISKPAFARANRSMQFFYVNGRLVQSGMGSAALSEAFRSSIQAGKFPACILCVSLPPQLVDVNVHPAKTQVRFAQEKAVFNVLYCAVKNALMQGDSPQPLRAKPRHQTGAIQSKAAQQTYLPDKPPDFWKKITVSEFFGDPKKEMNPQEIQKNPQSIQANPKERQEIATVIQINPQQEKSVPRAEPVLSADLLWNSPQEETFAFHPALGVLETAVQAKENIATVTQIEPEAPCLSQEPELFVLGEAFATYLLAQRGNELLFIDKHAAHERMIFEQMKACGGERSAQILMQPEVVLCSKEEYNAVLDETELFEKAGFSVSDFGDGMIAVHSCPMELDASDIPALLQELAGQLLGKRRELLPQKLDWLYHSIACRAAVKAGDFTAPQERALFVQKLLQMPDIRYCPHGRPVLFTLSRKELEKNFGRA